MLAQDQAQVLFYGLIDVRHALPDRGAFGCEPIRIDRPCRRCRRLRVRRGRGDLRQRLLDRRGKLATRGIEREEVIAFFQKGHRDLRDPGKNQPIAAENDFQLVEAGVLLHIDEGGPDATRGQPAKMRRARVALARLTPQPAPSLARFAGGALDAAPDNRFSDAPDVDLAAYHALPRGEMAGTPEIGAAR